MCRKQKFTVTLTFSDDIVGKNEIKEVATNIARAIKAETNGLGISPAEGDVFTTQIRVKAELLDEPIIVNIF
jgi:hypothetical protein